MKLLALIATVFALALAGTAQAGQGGSGMASWYGPGLYGNNLACGGVLTTSTWGVAHKFLPCGTVLTICYNRCVRVTVIDRGPFVYGRDWDLTYPVKSAIGMPSVGRVHYTIR